MSAPVSKQSVPAILDAWRQVTARREYEGRVPLASMERLASLLADAEGDASFSMEFDRDEFGAAYIGLKIDAELPLLCQRTLERFLLPVHVEHRMGLIQDEADEAGLPPDYEPLLIEATGELRTFDLVEDELILAVPVVPIMPGTEAVDGEWTGGDKAEPDEKPNPFAVLAALKQRPE